MKRFLAVLLCLLMCVSMLPVAAFAEEAEIDDENLIEEHKHDMAYVAAVEPSFKPGHIAYYYCADCGGMYADADGETELADADIIRAAIHIKPTDSKKIKVTPATCTRNGKIEYTCAVEGCNVKGVEVIPAHGVEVYHAENQATCFANGNIEYYQCSECGRIYADAAATQELQSIVVPALTHSLVKVEARNATCAAGGNIEHWKCEYCGTLFADAAGTETTTIEAVATSKLPHPLTRTDANDATCDTDGNIEYWTCSGCGGIFLDEAGENAVEAADVVIEKLGHDLEAVLAKPACLKNGNIQYWVCKRENCGKVFSDAEGTREITLADTVIPEIGHHDFNGGFCTKCKAEDPDYEGPSFKDENLTYTPGQPLVIRIDADYETSIENNWSVTINGVAIDPAFIVMSEGSTILTISEGGLKQAALKVGDNNDVTVQLKQGTVSGPLTVKENPVVIIDSPIPNGSVSADNTTPGVGATVTLTVVPDEEYALKPGSLSVKDENNSPLTVSKVSGTYIFTMPALDVTVTAEFVKKHKVTVTGGTADPTSAGPGETVTVEATIPDGKAFKQWTITPSGLITDVTLNPATFTMPDSEVSVSAEFMDKYNVTVTGGTANPTSAAPNETVTVTATIPDGKAFKQWTSVPSGLITNVTANPATFTMPASNVTITATFKDLYKVTINPTTNGTVTVDKSAADEKETVKLTITPKKNYIRDSIKVVNDTTKKQITVKGDQFTMPASNVTVSASFKRIKIEKGNGGTAHYGSRYSFTLNTKFEDVEKIEVRDANGKLMLDPLYVSDNAKGIVTLRRSFIKSLKVGTYDIAIVTDLGTAYGSFKVSNSPKTGDDSNVALWVTVGVISAAGVAGIAYYLLKKRKK